VPGTVRKSPRPRRAPMPDFVGTNLQRKGLISPASGSPSFGPASGPVNCTSSEDIAYLFPSLETISGLVPNQARPRHLGATAQKNVSTGLRQCSLVPFNNRCASYALTLCMAVSWGIEIAGFRDDHLARIGSYRTLEVQRDFRPMFGTHRSRPQTSSQTSAQRWLPETWDAI
jgi:hypothetical protein